MFDTSLGLGLWSIVTNIFAPLVPGILIMRIVSGLFFRGRLLYILAWFVGVGVIAHRMFVLQFVHYGIGIGEYFILLCLLIGIFVSILQYHKKHSLSQYSETLVLSLDANVIKVSYHELSRIEKNLVIVLGIFIVTFLINSFVFTMNFPTYADDSFGNRNKPIVNILHDGGIKLFGHTGEILARSRLGYPLHIPIYKAVISQMNGGYNDIYNNIFQYLCLLFGSLFIVIITFKQTNNFFLSLLPLGLIYSLPLVFIHSVEGYMELPSAMYSVIIIWLGYHLFKTYQGKYMSSLLLLLWTLVYIKNDGFVVYAGGIVGGSLLSVILLGALKKVIAQTKIYVYSKHMIIDILLFMLCFVPFLGIKMYHGLGFNQAAGEASGVSISFYPQVLSMFPQIFLSMDNYGGVLIVLGCIIVSLYMIRLQKRNIDVLYLGLTSFSIWCVFLLVFLFTENYKFALDQTTINRVFTSSFIIIISFISIVYHAAFVSKK